MATSSSQSFQLSGSLFPLPPVPDTSNDFASDEESFVVLGHSLDCDISPSLVTTPVAEKNIIDRIEQSVDNVLAELSDNSSEPPLPVLENHFQPKEDLASVTTISSTLPSDEIEKRVSLLVQENQHLKNVILQNNMSMKAQYQRIVAWREDVEKTYEGHKRKFEEAKTFIISLKSENKELNKIVERQAKEIAELKNAEINHCAEKLEENTVKKASDFEKLLAESREENNRLQSEIQRLKSLLENHSENKRKSTELKLMDESNISDYIALQEDIKKMRHQLMLAQQTITELECNKTMFLNQMSAKDAQISKLQNLLEQFKYTEDDMFALKEQLEVYKTDFETERTAKETIRSEKNQMADDINNLHDRNRKLQEEVEVYRNQNGYVYVPERTRSSTSRTHAEQSSEMLCPKCSFKFKTYQALENHVYRCLNLN